MFLIGGPAFSGTTLLSLLLNQGNLICLDEPDFHNPEQRHRGIPLLQDLFPGKSFPALPATPLAYPDAVRLIRACEAIIAPIDLGIKTCDQIFLDYAQVYKANLYPVIAIIRDIRDALVRPLPEWLTEGQLNRAYRLVWNHLNLCDLWFRYEDLVTESAPVMSQISRVLKHPLTVMERWEPEAVHDTMLKLDRHELLKSGRISPERVGIWKTSGLAFAKETIETAQMMGY